jgi:lysophospholipase L1-like esterase
MPHALAALAMLTMGPGLMALTGGEIAVKDGEKIAFLGDSITQGGMGPTGYVSLVIQGLKTAGVSATGIGAGISGHKSNDMLARLQRDVIDKKPDWMTVSCGVNDVWHGAKGVPLDAYKKNMTEIIEKAQAAGIKVVILTATMIGENPAEPNNQKLAAYNDFLHDLAKEKKCLLADLNSDMHKELDEREKAGKKRGNSLTSDGVHMNPFGNMMMAAGILRALGLDDARLSKAREAWLDIPNGASFTSFARLTLRQLGALEAIAAKQGKSVQALLQEALDKEVSELLKK